MHREALHSPSAVFSATPTVNDFSLLEESQVHREVAGGYAESRGFWYPSEADDKVSPSLSERQ